MTQEQTLWLSIYLSIGLIFGGWVLLQVEDEGESALEWFSMGVFFAIGWVFLLPLGLMISISEKAEDLGISIRLGDRVENAIETFLHVLLVASMAAFFVVLFLHVIALAVAY